MKKKLIIDENVINKCKLTLGELLYLLLLYKNSNIESIKNSLLEKNLIIPSLEGISITGKGIKKILTINNNLLEEINYEEVAKSLQKLYPRGKKAGTNCMWRDSTVIIAKKLKTLVEKYHCHFTIEQAIRVTRNYVQSFNGDYTYMQVLKYFLLKSRTTEDNEREVNSEFMSRLENDGQENEDVQDWSTDLV